MTHLSLNQARKLPSVHFLLQHPDLLEFQATHGKDLVVFCIRHVVAQERQNIQAGQAISSLESIIEQIKQQIHSIAEASLKPVINASGILLHTNLGRAPFSAAVFAHAQKTLSHYCNLEFDLASAKRGRRETHAAHLICYLTGAEDAVVVNNNAAAVMLCLKTLAEQRQVIVSRGELIEIGGSFRIPDIMAASGAQMIEVGTTNRTRLSDYQQAINQETAALFKAHKSNYAIHGFTEEASVKDLAQLAHQHGLPFIYDMGSGLLRKPQQVADALRAEPDVQSTIAAGVDLLTFSCDKLLGGPQGGIIAGRKKWIEQIKRAPMMRALRVGKLTLTFLEATLQTYLSPQRQNHENQVFHFLNRPLVERQQLAEQFLTLLQQKFIAGKIIATQAVCGGGTLPDTSFDSVAIELTMSPQTAEIVYPKLLLQPLPILGILRQGKLLLDLFTLDQHQLSIIADSLAKVVGEME